MAQNKELNNGQRTGSFSPSYLPFSCDICCAYLPSPYQHNLFLHFSESASGDGSATEYKSDLINDQLLLYFIVKKLLKFEDEQFLDLLLDFDGEERVASTGFDGTISQRFYLNKVCLNCEKIISDAIDMYKNLIKLQRKIENLGEELRNLIKWSNKRGTQENKLAKKMGSYISNECDERAEFNDDGVADQVSSPSFKNVKVEAECINEDDDFESNDDPLNVMANWDDSISTTFDEELGELKANVDSKQNRTSKLKRKRKSSEASSDYSSDEDFLPSKSIKKNCRMKQSVGSVERDENYPSTKGTKGSNVKGRSSFTCSFCKMVHNTAHGFKNHLKAHEESTKVHGNKYDCPKCKFPALSERKLRYHLTTAHEETHKNRCLICGYVGSRRWIYDKHMLEKHGVQVWTPIDKETNKTGTQTNTTTESYDDPEIPKDATMHIKNDTAKEKQFENENFRCEKCATVYKTRVYFQRHQEAHKLSEELNHKFDCDECGFPANSEKFLRYHKIREHKQYLMRTCTLCGHQVKRLDQMKLHMKNHHSGQPGSTTGRKHQNHLEAAGSTTGRKHQNHLEAAGSKMGRMHHTPSVGSSRSRKHRNQSATGRKLLNQATESTRGRKRKCSGIKINGRFKCDLCGYSYANSGGLKRHMEDHAKSDEMGKTWECNSCGFPCLSEQRLHRHVQIKHEKDPLTCSICQRSFGRRYLLKAHLLKHKQFDKTLDPTTGLFCCDLCPNKYNSLEGVILHKAKGHPEANNCLSTGGVGKDSHLCQQCGRCYTTSLQLRRHIRIQHEGFSTHTCEICGKGINGKVKLAEHKRTHEENRVKEHVCEICGSAYTAKDTLTKHLKKYHSKGGGLSANQATKRSYKCKFCDETFPLKLLFEKHLESVHSDKYTFQCNLCEKSYISASSLRLHKEINHGEGGGGKHACKYCGKEFTHKHNVICHYKWCSVKRKEKLKQEAT